MPRQRKRVTELRLHGQYRADRHGARPEEPHFEGVPEKPEWLKGDAAHFWDAVIDQLVRTKAAAQVDSFILAAACRLWSLYRKADEAAENDPLDKDTRIAAIGYFRAWSDAAGKLGLTPADRARVAGKAESSEKPRSVPSRQRGA